MTERDAVYVAHILDAAKRTLAYTRARYPQIPWRVMAGMRDRLIHGYFGVDLSAVWKTCTSDVPELIKQLDEVRDE